MKGLTTVAELKTANYTVVEEHNNITVTSDKPFKVVRGQKAIPAQLSENVYTASVTGLIVNDVVPFKVVPVSEQVSPFPLISSLVESIKPVQAQAPTKMVPFEVLKVGAKFTVDGVQYVKESANSYVKDRKFVQTGTPTIVEGQFDVEGPDFNVLSPDQMRDIVQHIPALLSDDELVDHLHDVLDNVAGFEDPDGRDEVIDQLVMMYHHNRKATR